MDFGFIINSSGNEKIPWTDPKSKIEPLSFGKVIS